MKKVLSHNGVRPNPRGDWPEVDPTAFVDPSAQIIGNVRIGPGVYVGPNAVVRADEIDTEGKVHPVVVQAECNIQDAVVIHAQGGSAVRIGARTSIAHGCIVHGPCVIGTDYFLGFRAVVFGATIEEAVWVGVGAIILEVSISSHTMVPAGSLVYSHDHVSHLRTTSAGEQQFQQNVLAANRILREGYWNLLKRGKAGEG
jgi:carbonic anhydrase/acetyltransferase-like protein (isoleucine patch superfamily)